MADLRMSQAVQQHHRGQHLHFGSGVRSLSEERTMATGGTATTSTMMSGTAAAAGATASAATAGMASASATSTPYRARGGNRPLLRSSRAEEIPDIYWEQAARELDFCTCRKCQVSWIRIRFRCSGYKVYYVADSQARCIIYAFAAYPSLTIRATVRFFGGNQIVETFGSLPSAEKERSE